MDLGAEGATIDASGGFFVENFHHGTHVLAGGGAGFGDGGFDQVRDFFRRELLGEVGVEDVDLGFLGGSHFGSAAFIKSFHGVLAFLDLFTDDGERVGVLERATSAAFFDGGVHEGGFEHAENAEFGGLPGHHGGFDVMVDAGLEGHGKFKV